MRYGADPIGQPLKAGPGSSCDYVIDPDSRQTKLDRIAGAPVRVAKVDVKPDRGGRYPIHYQALEGRTDDLAESLVEGADPSVADAGGFTALHFAAQSLHYQTVRLLIEAGADVDARNRFGATPLLVALGKANDDDHGVVDLLLDAGADVNAENNYGVSPRSLAERVSNFDLKKFLVQKE